MTRTTRLQANPARKVDYSQQLKRSGGGVRKSKNHLYPDQDRVQDRKRPGMTKTTTVDMLKRAQGDSGRTSASRIMEVDQFDAGSGARDRGLKDLGFTRNHTIADSSVAALVGKSIGRIRGEPDPLRKDRMAASGEQFLRALGGGEESVGAFRGAREATTSAQLRQHTDKAVNLGSHGMNNLRFDDGARNTTILHGADYPVASGSITSVGSELRHRVLELARTGAVPREDAFNAVQPTIQYGTTSGGLRFGKYRTSAEGDSSFGNMQDVDTLRPARREPARRHSMPDISGSEVDRSEAMHSRQVLLRTDKENPRKHERAGDKVEEEPRKRVRTGDLPRT